MITKFNVTPREFTVGGRTIKDHGTIVLEAGEMVSFRTGSGRECDVTAMEWGFYLGPSLNGRLRRQGFKAALVAGPDRKVFLNAVEEDRVDEFLAYLEGQGSHLICWIDDWFPGPGVP